MDTSSFPVLLLMSVNPSGAAELGAARTGTAAHPERRWAARPHQPEHRTALRELRAPKGTLRTWHRWSGLGAVPRPRPGTGLERGGETSAPSGRAAEGGPAPQAPPAGPPAFSLGSLGSSF